MLIYKSYSNNKSFSQVFKVQSIYKLRKSDRLLNQSTRVINGQTAVEPVILKIYN